ncbi:MAG: hypothetical protein L6Q37_02080 [Bdellovibrionaceae bacterium]|nr:hypothetical protein [Pseudobdellovibrionaceae bacterium]NUM58455.1 hypothetical protein [Pseudobdellovibrionaceae bacterium]
MKFFIGILTLLISFNVFAKEISVEGLKELKRYQLIHNCYNKFLEVPGQSGQKTGKLVIDLILDKSGKVLGAKENSKDSTIHEDALNSCLFSSLKKLKFPKEASGDEAAISITLTLPLEDSAH